MATNLALDTQLLQEALSIGGLKSKKDTVNTALREFVERRKQREILGIFGTMPFDEDYNYKKARQ